MLKTLSPVKLVCFLLKRSSPFTIDATVFNVNEKCDKKSQVQESGNISLDFFKNVVCPLTKKPLRYDSERQLLINDELGIGYKVENGILNMIPTEAIKLDRL